MKREGARAARRLFLPLARDGSAVVPDFCASLDLIRGSGRVERRRKARNDVKRKTRGSGERNAVTGRDH